ncbi:DUF3846 domain-containing protein [Orrella sp. JC864]|uniref:DUF3846 domain-containing protein n=1 Tax=Orrella sp. JC864 TaxID=3120298 RepID=UPI00300AEC46
MTTTPIRMLLRADGAELPLVGPHSIQDIQTMLGADALDVVRMADRIHVMLVDDAGQAKGLPVNVSATAHYHAVCRPGVTQPILGDVVIVPDSDYARFA